MSKLHYDKKAAAEMWRKVEAAAERCPEWIKKKITEDAKRQREQMTPMTHTLKTWPEYFEAVRTGEKPFELRKADRPFNVGNVLHLVEYDPATDTYSGRECHRIITYRLDGPAFGLMEGYCILGLGFMGGTR